MERGERASLQESMPGPQAATWKQAQVLAATREEGMEPNSHGQRGLPVRWGCQAMGPSNTTLRVNLIIKKPHFSELDREEQILHDSTCMRALK